MYGDPVTIEGTAQLSRCVQHETDHLDGVLFIDRLDPETRKAAMRAIRESEWFGAAGTGRQGQPAPDARPRVMSEALPATAYRLTGQ